MKGKGRINVLVHNNEKVNSLENVFEEAPGGVRILSLKTRHYSGIQCRARGKTLV